MTEKLEQLDEAQHNAELEFVHQKRIFDEMRGANEDFMGRLEEQLMVLVQATPRFTPRPTPRAPGLNNPFFYFLFEISGD